MRHGHPCNAMQMLMAETVKVRVVRTSALLGQRAEFLGNGRFLGKARLRWGTMHASH